jgi:hypothetical protein
MAHDWTTSIGKSHHLQKLVAVSFSSHSARG